MIDVLAKLILTAHGGDAAVVPTWKSADFDSIYVIKLTWSGSSATASFERDQEGLDGRSTTCPN